MTEKFKLSNASMDGEETNTHDVFEDICHIIDKAQRNAYQTVDYLLLRRNWLLGKRIALEELKGRRRGNYGLTIIESLSKKLKEKYGKGYTKTNLYSYYQFFLTYPNIFHAVSGKSPLFLPWTHYRILLQLQDGAARAWYEKESLSQGWSSRTLQRNISSQYYYRILQNQKQYVDLTNSKTAVGTAKPTAQLEFIKNPLIAEFLGLSANPNFTENELENTIISNLQKFMMELGKGYAFVARQQRIQTEKEDYYIDLVFYNYILKCFVLIDLKTQKITHQDVGQMDMYLHIYDELRRNTGDNPTLGIILCSDTDEDIARYSILHGNERLFASKYKLYLPSEEELRKEIETQKDMFLLQQAEERSLV